MYYLYWELELVVEFSYQLVVCQGLTHLHDTNDRGVDLVLPVLKHSLRRAYILFLLHRHIQIGTLIKGKGSGFI